MATAIDARVICGRLFQASRAYLAPQRFSERENTGFGEIAQYREMASRTALILAQILAHRCAKTCSGLKSIYGGLVRLCYSALNSFGLVNRIFWVAADQQQ